MSQLAFLVGLAGLSTPDATTTVSRFAHSLLFELLGLDGFRRSERELLEQSKERKDQRKNKSEESLKPRIARPINIKYNRGRRGIYIFSAHRVVREPDLRMWARSMSILE